MLEFSRRSLTWEPLAASSSPPAAGRVAPRRVHVFEDGNSYSGKPTGLLVTSHAWISQLADSRVPALEAWLHSFSMLSFSSNSEFDSHKNKQSAWFWGFHDTIILCPSKHMVFSFTQSPHRSLSSLEQNPGKDDQRQRGPHPTGVCWCQMNFQEHRVVHVDGHPILEVFWRMIQTWQQVTNITMRKIPGNFHRGKRSS